MSKREMCTACLGAPHPREAHYDPALARAESEKADARGDHNQAKAWRWVASNLERRHCA